MKAIDAISKNKLKEFLCGQCGYKLRDVQPMVNFVLANFLSQIASKCMHVLLQVAYQCQREQ